ncbi:type II toxin-antitoxin system prevent-host-death family antitoxin [Streptomyces sp. DSM 44917]|uniref:Type II toxin-antitoxin system prevent-host-death family antitoxin n=1 Tax=Streptomyces boetiae TaxID=3075541 RepID=A0ABU2LG03_9ACTN|nr:type II toxin-antitoxin system prevent-host-death family antitoxin [Streptomyces sp. DSM 44917]MDT0310518.1 type II toxin-antitoxin system prevent-host-death family antitoxin [Streptomyces sp. DSM 44917]
MPNDALRDPSEHLRLHWGEVLADAAHRGVHREVTRNDRVVAVFVPPDWYATARRTHPAPQPQSWTSRAGREDLTRVLDAVEYEGAHATITRYGRPAAAVVPTAWYESATAASRSDDDSRS